jgi:hypothetical protein
MYCCEMVRVFVISLLPKFQVVDYYAYCSMAICLLLHGDPVIASWRSDLEGQVLGTHLLVVRCD